MLLRSFASCVEAHNAQLVVVLSATPRRQVQAIRATGGQLLRCVSCVDVSATAAKYRPFVWGCWVAGLLACGTAKLLDCWNASPDSSASRWGASAARRAALAACYGSTQPVIWAPACNVACVRLIKVCSKRSRQPVRMMHPRHGLCCGAHTAAGQCTLDKHVEHPK